MIHLSSDLVRNLYVQRPSREGVSLPSNTHAKLRLAGDCLILDWNQAEHTPVFVETGEPIRVFPKEIYIYSQKFPLGVDLSMPGLVPSEDKLTDVGKCPSSIVFVTGISEAEEKII